METSFKQRCLEEWKIHHRKLLRTLRNEGPAVLGNVSESDYIRVEERLKKIIKGPEQSSLKPKAASKMIVSELKEELEAQGLPTDGTRNVLYQRVQKARRINRSRGRPLWVPPVEEEEEEVNLSIRLSFISFSSPNFYFINTCFPLLDASIIIYLSYCSPNYIANALCPSPTNKDKSLLAN